MAYSDTAEGQYRVVMPNVEIAKKTGKHLMIGCETMDLDEARREDGNCAISYFEGRQNLHVQVLADHYAGRGGNL